MFSNKLPAYRDIDKMIISFHAGCTGFKFHFTISPGAIIIVRLAENCCNYSLLKSSSGREENASLDQEWP